MRKDCVGCPAFNGSVCRINKWEAVSMKEFYKSKRARPLPKDIQGKVSVIFKNSDTRYDIRLFAYKSRQFLDCHKNTYIDPIIADVV